MQEPKRDHPNQPRLRTRSPFGTGIAFLGAGLAFLVIGVYERNRLTIMGVSLVVLGIAFLASGICPPSANVQARTQEHRHTEE